jgi:threonine/homoserine/homoserine lactone efflux protein
MDRNDGQVEKLMLVLLIQGLTLGFAAAAQPGPFQAYVVAQVFSMGWRRTLPAALAPLVSDGPILLVVLLALSRIPDWLQRALSVSGGIFILYLAAQAWVQLRQMRLDQGGVPKPEPVSRYKSLWRAALMNALNPGPYLFWSLAAGPILLRAWREAPENGLSFILGFYSAMVASLAAMILLFGTAERAGQRFRRIFSGLSILALTGFGVYQVWRGLEGF